MNDELRKDIIKTWMGRARKNYTGTVSGLNPGIFWADSLIYVWIPFEAFTTSKFNLRSADKRVEKFKEEYKDWFRSKTFSSTFNESMNELIKYEVKDMRPVNPDPPITITDRTKLEEIVDVVYRVRCNLFHGGKSSTEQKDIELMQFSFKVIYKILDNILREECIEV